MGELQQLEKLQKTVREIKRLQILVPEIEPPKNKLSQNQIFAGGQMNMIIRVVEIIDKNLGQDF